MERVALPKKAEGFSEELFEQQFSKVMQVLDTDYDSYLIIYTCQDSSEWLEQRSGIEMDYE